MKVLGLVIEKRRVYERKERKAAGLVENLRIVVDRCDKITADRDKLQGELKTKQYHLMQKLSLVAKKDKRIQMQRELLKHQQEQLAVVSKQGYEDLQGRDQMIYGLNDEIKELRRVIKCLREQVRAKNKRIAKLKEGINIPAEVAKEQEKSKMLCIKLSRQKKAIYDATKRLEAAKQLIAILKSEAGNERA